MINKFYISKDAKGAIKDAYKKSSPNHVLLQDFFEKNFYQDLKNNLFKKRGTLERIPNKFSYETLTDLNLVDYLSSKEFLDFISFITGATSKIREISIKKFKHKDYTLIHDEQKHSETLKFIFFIPTKKELPKSSGGEKIFQLDGGKDNLRFSPIENSLVLIKQGKEDYDFVQYLNNLVGREELIVVEGIFN